MVLSDPCYQGDSVEAPKRPSEMVKSKNKRKSKTHLRLVRLGCRVVVRERQPKWDQKQWLVDYNQTPIVVHVHTFSGWVG